jgi:hypothetical protein
VLKDGNLPVLQAEAQKLKGQEPHTYRTVQWGDRTQHFWWVNDIVYEWTKTGARQSQHVTLHYVHCEETWTDARAGPHDPVGVGLGAPLHAG